MRKIKRFAVGILAALAVCLVAVSATGCVQKGGREKPGHQCSWEFAGIKEQATCEADAVANMKCSGCGKTKTETVSNTKKGHSLEVHKKVEPTCLTVGYEAYEKCTRCSYVKGTANKEIAKKDHSTTNKDSKPANCQQPAYCGVCKTYYGDKLMDHETNFVVIPQQVVTCARDGWESYVKCMSCTYSTQEVITKLGHSKTHPDSIAVTCTTLAYCGVCQQEYGELAEHNKIYEEGPGYCGSQKAVCGESEAYCGACEQYYGGIPQHDIKYIEAKEVTCEQDGYYAYEYCQQKDCGYTTKEVIEAYGHDEVIIEAREPDCVTMGWNEGSQCARCFKTLREPIARPALGHDDGDRGDQIGFISSNSYLPDCMNEGYCGICKEYYGNGSTVGRHTIITVPEQAATCTSDGWYEYEKCAYCSYSTYSENVIPRTPHFNEYFERVEPTCTTPGREAGMACRYCTLLALPEIPALGHDGNREGQTEFEDTESYLPECGGVGYCGICDQYYDSKYTNHVYSNGECIYCDKKRDE